MPRVTKKVLKKAIAEAWESIESAEEYYKKEKEKDPFYALEQKEKEARALLFSVLTENARLIEDNKRLRRRLIEARKTIQAD